MKKLFFATWAALTVWMGLEIYGLRVLVRSNLGITEGTQITRIIGFSFQPSLNFCHDPEPSETEIRYAAKETE